MKKLCVFQFSKRKKKCCRLPFIEMFELLNSPYKHSAHRTLSMLQFRKIEMSKPFHLVHSFVCTNNNIFNLYFDVTSSALYLIGSITVLLSCSISTNWITRAHKPTKRKKEEKRIEIKLIKRC